MEQIKTMAELEKVCEELQAQGFGYFSSYEFREKKLASIINNANTLHLDIRHSNYTDKFDGDFVKFEADMQEHFGQYDKSDKIEELANKRGVDYKGKSKRDMSERTWHRKDKSISLRAYWDYYTFNELFELMGYTGDKINSRSEYNKVPYYMDENYNKIFKPAGKITRSSYGKLRTVYWTTYANGNLKLTGDIDEFNELYTKLRERYQESETQRENGINYILID